MFSSTIKIGNVRGIQFGLNWSWLIIFALIVWSLAAAVFPEVTPDLSAGAYIAMAVIAAVLFFASLLLHELGHALQAEREGMQIDGITLWLFGGVAKFTGMFPSAGAEFRIAIAGPLVTLGIVILLSVVSLLFAFPDAVVGVVGWLATINLVLLVFNLLPAFPLDGGRVLRAALWSRRGDFAWATESAGKVGRGFGQFLIAFGILLTFLARAPGGLWLAFIGWFLMAAASAETRLVGMRAAFSGMTVSDLMVRDPVTVPADMSVSTFVAEIFPHHRFNAYPVLGHNDAVIGILPVRAIKATDASRWSQTPVTQRMISLGKALTMSEGKDLGEAVSELAQTDVGRALVMRDAHLVGLLSMTDAQRMLDLRPQRGENLPTHAGAP